MKCHDCIKVDVCKNYYAFNVSGGKYCNFFKSKHKTITFPFAIGDEVFTITQRADTKTSYVWKAKTTIENALYYKRLFDEGRAFTTRVDALEVLEIIKKETVK